MQASQKKSYRRGQTAKPMLASMFLCRAALGNALFLSIGRNLRSRRYKMGLGHLAFVQPSLRENQVVRRYAGAPFLATGAVYEASYRVAANSRCWETIMVIGNRLKELRESKELSQSDIEKRTGLLRPYISRVENGHTVPAVETLEKLARALEVPMYQLFPRWRSRSISSQPEISEG